MNASEAGAGTAANGVPMPAAPPGNTLERLQSLVDEFRRLRAEGVEARLADMGQVVAEFTRIVAARPQSFNALEILRIGADEVLHSAVLAWLLDAGGSHGQGLLFVNSLAEALGLPVCLGPKDRYLVGREFPGKESVVDICVCRPGDLVIYIENKILAPEGPSQLARELRDLHRTAEANGVPPGRRFAIFLTPDGRPPISGDPSPWRCLSYTNLVAAFGADLPSSGDARLAWFLGDWLDTISQWGAES